MRQARARRVRALGPLRYNPPVPVLLKTSLLLALSNVFMTFAWYAHLRNLSGSKWYVAALASWGIALFEYLLQVPANRIGSDEFSITQLKIIQEAITLAVFTVIAYFLFGETLKWNNLVSYILLIGAVFFAFLK